jgi:hypothetical protein
VLVERCDSVLAGGVRGQFLDGVRVGGRQWRRYDGELHPETLSMGHSKVYPGI